jgi:hypothetical protein
MRLLNTHDLQFKEFAVEPEIRYAILSHRWDAEHNEISFKDHRKKTKQGASGYVKIRNFCEIARGDGFDWAWIDTCCIDKRSSAELTQSINSMYSWYRNANTCYAYLRDVGPQIGWESSEWWRRGWTLQELIASTHVVFYNQHWQKIGTKADLAPRIERITSIPKEVLLNERLCLQYCVAQKMSWAAGRHTTCIEDRAYSLLGLFRINMPLLYGEGTKAFQRLQLEVLQKYPDESVFAWSPEVKDPHLILATSPDSFASCRDLTPRWQDVSSRSYNPDLRLLNPPRITSWGIEIRANARKLCPRQELLVQGEQQRFLWAITLTSTHRGFLQELPCLVVLVRYGPVPWAYRRFDRYCFETEDECLSDLSKSFKVGIVELDQLFYLQFDQDLDLELGEINA